MIEENNALKAKNNQSIVGEDVGAFGATKILYQKKYEEMKELKDEQTKYLRAVKAKNHSQAQVIKELQEGKKRNEGVMSQKDATIAKLREENEALMRELAETKRMLSQSSGHEVMKMKIEEHQKTTRDALSYVAEVKRERSIFTPRTRSLSRTKNSEQYNTLKPARSYQDKT